MHDGTETVFAAPAPWARELIGGYAGFRESVPHPVRRVEVPPPRTTLVLAFGGRLRVWRKGGVPRSLAAFVTGPCSGPAIAEHDGVIQCLEVDFPPYAAPIFFAGAAALGSDPVPLSDLWGADAGNLIEQLTQAMDWATRLALVDKALRGRQTIAPPPPRSPIIWAWRELVRTQGGRPIRSLAREIGWSERHFATRFHVIIGTTPKAFARRLRFDAVRRRLESGGLETLCRLAAEYGYADQSHMVRDFQVFAGCAPSTYRRARLKELAGISAEAAGYY